MRISPLHLILSLVLLGIGGLSAAAPGLHPPQNPPGVVPIVQQTYPGVSRFFVDSTIYQSPFRNFKRIVRLDSTGSKVEIRELLYDKDYRLPVVMDLNYYIQKRLAFENKKNWLKSTLKTLLSTRQKGSSGLELNIPVKIRSKAFKRIFGGDRVGLRVTGNITFELAGRTESREGSAVTSVEQRGNFSPRFKQTQQFQVEGRVGDKVSVKVDQNSEATFDLENTLRLTYTGDEDEIIQKIEAGNVNLSLPSTNYVSASSKHQGLFGLKTRMQMGNLSFVGIASLERGEKQKITKTGKSSENTFSLKDYEYVRNRFFFVDSVYAENFEKGYNPKTMTWQVFGQGAYRITQLDVWIKAKVTDQDTREGWAVIDPDRVRLDTLSTEIPGKTEHAYFKRLELFKDYNYDEYRGFFWLNQNVDDQDIVAVAYQTEGGLTKGMLFNQINDSTSIILLKLVKPKAAKPDYHSTWKLAMRNVYNLGAAQIKPDGFDVKILYSKTGDDVDVQPVGVNKPFIYLMGLDRLDEQGNFIDGGDKKVDVNNGNIFDLSNGYLIFPSLQPFAPPENSEFGIDKSLYVNIYDIKDRTKEQQEHKFKIAITTSSVSSTYNLGFNVLEGSEVVRLNGRELKKDKDYTIDYFGGTLQILDPEARRADANVEIEYERGNLFQLDKKTLVGGRMEYSFGDRGFIGLTGLYLNKSTLDQRIRLGQEPVRNFIWDVNTALDFHPNFLTKALDKLPIVETSAESRLHVEAEFAQVNPNPNTFNEGKLGEKQGVAYIDDFEGSERKTPLGIIYRTWSPASIPARFRIPERNIDYNVNISDDSLMYKMDENRVRMFWFNPYNQVPIKDIWPNKDVNAQTGTTTNVLVLEWKNDHISPDSAWGGIMRSTVNFPDQNKTKFIELWIKGGVGRVNVDIGRINEDFYIRRNTFTFDGKRSLRNLNTEDKNLNGLLDDGEDVGLDGVPDGNPFDDPFDNWRPPLETTPNFIQINGTEGNGQAKGAKYPDTEDLDGDGGLSLTNEYFSYSFNLADSTSRYVKGSTAKGWRLYRIPIRSYDPELVVGQPDTNFREIFFVRLWVNDLPKDDQYHAIQIATFDFVGNEWEEIGVAQDEQSNFVKNDSLFSIAVYNTEENTQSVENGPEAYHSPPNVTGVRDRITHALSKEQSLVLQLGDLPPGGIAEANKQLYEKMNLIHYKKLKMFVHGDHNLPDQDSPLEFFLRFGPTESIYYEVGGKVYPHWDDRNHIDVVMDELAKTKLEQYFTGDSLNGQPIYFRQDPNNPEKYFKVVGQPNLRNINYMIIGARNVGTAPIQNMEIWIDELRVTDVERDKGTAMRLLTDLTLADVATFRAQWEVVDSDFRRIEDQFGSGSTLEKQQYRVGLKLHKFFPESWKLQIPVSGGYVRTRNIPKYFFNSDRLTNYRANGIGDKLQQFFGLNTLSPELAENSRISETKSLGATISRKASPREPWYLKYTLDMLTLDVDWNKKHGSDERNLLNDASSLNARLQIKVPFGRESYFKPFGWLGNGPIVRMLSNQKMAYLPNSMSMSLNVRDNENTRQARLESSATRTIKTTSSRKFSLGYNLFPSLSMNLSRDYQSDGQLKGYRAPELMKAIFTKLDFGVDKLINQNFNTSYSPRLASWLTSSFKYSSGFNYNFSNVNTNERSSRVQVTKQISVSFKPSMLANKIYNPLKSKLKQKKASRSNRSSAYRGGPRRGTQKPPAPPGVAEPGGKPSSKKPLEEDERAPEKAMKNQEKAAPAAKQATPEKKGRKVLPSFQAVNPLKLVWKFFNAWKSISLDYRLTDNYNHYNIDGIPDMKYQFGFSSDPGVGTDTTFRKIPRLPAIKNSKNVTGSISFDIIKNLATSFKYNYAKDANQNNQQKTENIASTYFFVGDDPEANKKFWSAFVPDWQLRLTGLEKLFLFKSFAKTVQLEHARSGKFNESNRFDEQGKTRDSWGYSNNYAPFLGLTINTKWGVTGNLRYTKSTTFNYNATGADSKGLRSGIDATFSYSKSTGFRLPLPFLKNKKLKNEMQFNLSFNSTSDITFAKRPSTGSAKFEEQTRNKSWKIKPSVTYRFSQKVNGSMFMERSVSQNKRTGKYSYFEFGVNVNIAIR